MANTNANVINCFSACGHVVYLYELTHHLYTEPRYVFTDEVLTPKEKDDGYDFESNMIYISKVYGNKEETESKFNKLRLGYEFNSHTMISNDDDKDLTVIPIRSDLYEKYMDSIMDKIVTITNICVDGESSFNDFECGFSIEIDLKFKINDIEFTAEAYAEYGDYVDGQDPNVNIIIYKDEKVAAFITDTFNLYIKHEHGEKSIVKSDNSIFATDVGASDIDNMLIYKYSIPENLNINLTSLGRFLVNRVYKEINDIISKVEQA